MVNVELFVRTSQAVAKVRRMKRPGYGDPEYEDLWRMEGYLEDYVWANYVTEIAGCLKKRMLREKSMKRFAGTREI